MFYLGIDIGTTGSKAAVFSDSGEAEKSLLKLVCLALSLLELHRISRN